MITNRVMQLSTNLTVISNISEMRLQAGWSILSSLSNVVTKSHLNNIIQHMTKSGTKASLEATKAVLEIFFKSVFQGGISSKSFTGASINGPAAAFTPLAMAGDFAGWYKGMSSILPDMVPRGYPLVTATSDTFDVQCGMNDHPLFSSSGPSAYYTNEV